ncbi:hypothetical protein F2Q69_00031675 [Brassica cretica]|uniref:Uncharacterized protein n=1 Tax=Brassica cretica TaxID=69181 RepID=A0A8S9RSW0_BRACR|nr:hypothetical protein F2Q69_00031675 [Brassica cretica]
MDAREEFSPSPDRSIDRVAPPPLRSDSKFGKGKGAVSGSNLPIDRSVGTRLLPSAIVSRQGLPHDSDPRELPQEDVDGDCVVEGTEEIVPAREKGDLAIERRSEGDCAANEIRRDRATIVDGTPDGGIDDRLIGPMGKIHRLTPLCYRHDGAIGKLLDLPSKLARPSVVQGQSWGDVLPTESTFRIAHPNTIGPQDTFWKDVPKVVVLNQQTWASFERQRISCQQKRIAKVDWSPDVPCVTTTGKRMKLPLMGHIPKAYPSYSELLRTQLRGESFSSMAASEGEDAEPQRSPAKETVIGGGDVAASYSVVEGIDVSTADAPSVSLLKKKKKKRNKSSKKVAVCSEDEKDLGEKNQVEGDHSTSEADGSNDLTEMGLVGSISAKRKEPTDGNFIGPGGKIQKRSRGPSPLSLKEIALPASRLLPWGGLSPPSDRFSLASSEHWTFCHDKDSPFVSDPDVCAELVRRIRGGSHLMPETSELAFPDGFIASAQADVEAAVRKNQLILDYELSLRRMASDFAKAEAAIESKDAEIEKSKRVALDKAKEMIAERSRFHREHKQDAEIIKGLEGELEAARSRIDRLEAEKAEEAEKAKRTMDHVRQVHRRELMSEMSCIGAAAADRFDKFRRYMVDRDKREEKLVLHSQAFGTLDGLGMLEEWGMPVPKKLKDILSANEVKFKEDLEGVVVEDITDHDLAVSSLPRLERLQGSNQFGLNVGSNIEVVDPVAACEVSIQEIRTAGTIGAAVLDSIAED